MVKELYVTDLRSILVALLSAFASGYAITGLAVTLNVNSIFDVVAAPPLDNGICETAPGNGVCTLRAAIMKANHFPGGGVTINVPANALPYKLSIPRVAENDETSGDLNIMAAMSIVGAGVGATVIDADGIDRVIDIDLGTPATVTISGVTLRNGITASVGGGINFVPVGLGRTLILTNSAVSGSSAFHGGGIFASAATITLSHVTLSGNAAMFMGGGIDSEGGSGLATINDSLVINNTAGSDGGGISFLSPGVLARSVVSGNRAGGEGGGIRTLFTPSLIVDSTITANQAATNGGGLSVQNASFATGTTTVENSTISANAAKGNGGGIVHSGAGSLQLFHVTIAGNVADSGDTAVVFGGGLYRAAGSGTVEVWNSMLVENYNGSVANECGGAATTSQDYNMFQTLFLCALDGTVTHNITAVVDPLLDGLKSNGGPTPTRALLSSSPALDQIPSALCRDSFGAAPNPDQRGTVRPVGPQCDMGAYEGTQPLLQFGRNLIRNGDAENGAGSSSAVFVRAPGWNNSSGLPTVLPYGIGGGFPSLTDMVPANHGYNFFAGGGGGSSGANQSIDVAALGAAIDAGQITYDMAGDFGGFANQNDAAALIVVFRDSSSQQIGGVHRIGDVNAIDRNNATGFLHRSASGLVPVGTRTIEIDLEMALTDPAYNDGYADNLSLVLTGGATAPILQSVASRKTHGVAGTLDLVLSPVPTNPSTEPRQGPTQTMVFTFDKPINAATVTVSEGVATAAAPTFSGNDVVVVLTGVINEQYVTVSLTNVASMDGGNGGSGSARIGFLAGDVNGSRVVTLADLGLVNAQLAQPVNATNFLKDVNASGTLTLTDKGIANANLTKALPPP